MMSSTANPAPANPAPNLNAAPPQAPGSAYLERALGARQRFLLSLAEPQANQERVLREALSQNRETAFAREHGLAEVTTAEEFRRRVPIRNYDGFAPWIERAAAGESQVLTAEDPLLFFSSSGSTGTPKKVPVTRSFAEKVYLPFAYAAIGNTALFCPEALERDDATLNMKWDPPTLKTQRTASGAAHLGASQVDFARSFGDQMAVEPGTRAPWALIPPEIEDASERMYYRLRLAIESDLRSVAAVNPALIAALPVQLAQWSERLIRELADGTVCGMTAVSGLTRTPNPARAQELARLRDYFGVLLPHHVWPHLRLIYCWTAGLAKTYLPHLRASYGPEVMVLPAPIAASEGPLGVPIDRHPTGGPLVVGSVFYEFIPAEADITPQASTLLFDELAVGCDYHAIITHIGGLYRYSLGDVVRVVDCVQGVPRVEYAGRNQHLALAGERLREAQVVDAVRAALATQGLAIRNFTCRPVTEPAHYRFLFAATSPWRFEECAALARSLDAQLQASSPGYREARSRDQLGSVVVRVAAAGAFDRHFAHQVAVGIRPNQIKDRVFQLNDEAWSMLSAESPVGSDGPPS